MNRANVLSLLVLYIMVITAALWLVQNRHTSRQLFMELQTLEKERDRLSAEWSRLKLEQSTILNQIRVDNRAKSELGMQKPTAAQIKVINE
ncbi:MAG: cell division protein FtsL [Thiotrichaceae bacterium]|jgi:cell division protein FtsL|uniref:Cell division protein FtsL n=1 Tax=Candidatus Thiocaldithrix dubininis TaxID=3080823 RepID=A0AA95KIJ8_9GAMM|nr:MAG: cell division protein FtsL [Candidatus Thiocaldithrix dubininis]